MTTRQPKNGQPKNGQPKNGQPKNGQRKFGFALAGVIVVSLGAAGAVSAQGMMDNDDGHTAIEEAAGAELAGALRSGAQVCENLTDEQFGYLGEYYMGLMLGDEHESMNAMMTRMIGEEGEEEMHVVMGKRLSSCEEFAELPGRSAAWLPMMNMMMGVSVRGVPEGGER